MASEAHFIDLDRLNIGKIKEIKEVKELKTGT